MIQISMKPAYGFIQFFEAEGCSRAIDAERNLPLKGNFLHLEVSKPQSNKRDRDDRRDDRNRKGRSRSPPQRRGDQGGPRGAVGNGRYDRPDHRNDRDRYRDDRGRKPGKFNDRRGSPPHRSSLRDRSPSYGDYRNDDYSNNYRPSRRMPQDVPECQIFLCDHLDNKFIQYVEQSFIDAGIRVNVDNLPVRVSTSSVLNQMLYEGVLGVVLLDRTSQNTGVIRLTRFDRSANGAKYEDFDNISISNAVGLVSIVKQKSKPPSYGAPPGSYSNTNFGSNAASYAPDSATLIGSLQNMDPESFQKVLSAALQSRQAQAAQNQPVQSVRPMEGMPGAYTQYNASAANIATNPYASSSMLNYNQGPGPSNPGQSTQQVQQMMEQLAKLQGRMGGN